MKELVREVKGVTGLPVAVHCHEADSVDIPDTVGVAIPR
jgi:pyruvate/oxaloacetate carboxyltransferase